MPHYTQKDILRGRKVEAELPEGMEEPETAPEERYICVIYDMDNTLTDANWRLEYVTGETKDWETFFTKAVYDKPNTPIVMMARSTFAMSSMFLEEYEEKNTNDIYHIENIVLTGRPEQYRQPTEMWLNYYKIPYKNLYMRPDGDRRADYKMKQDILVKNILSDYEKALFAVDDRKSVVDMFRKNNITALQCESGDVMSPEAEES